MRIAIVTAVFHPYRGGMASVAKAHAEILSGLGHDVTVFAPGPVVEPIGAAYRVVRPHPVFSIGKGAFLPQLGLLLRGFDQVILHYPAFGIVGPMIFWRLSAGRKTRFSVVYHMDPIAEGIRGAVFRALTVLTLAPLLTLADAVAVTSLDYASAGPLSRMPKRVKAKYRAVPLSVDTDRFFPKACAQGDAERFGLGDRNLIFVGGMDRAHWFKGVDILLRAFAAAGIPDSKLHLVGSGGLMRRYRDDASRLGLGDRAVFHGSLEDEALMDLLACVDALVLPSVGRSEAFGVVLLEAMASGKPVVASRLPGVRTVVREGETGLLVEPGDVGSLARAIETVLRDRTLASKLGERGREDILARFSGQAARVALAAFVSGPADKEGKPV